MLVQYCVLQKANIMNLKAMFKIGYGLYILTASENGFDNGCIINTVSQVTSSPVSYTHLDVYKRQAETPLFLHIWQTPLLRRK